MLNKGVCVSTAAMGQPSSEADGGAAADGGADASATKTGESPDASKPSQSPSHEKPDAATKEESAGSGGEEAAGAGGMAGASESAQAGQSGGCDDGALRCSTQTVRAIERCAAGQWTTAQTCEAEEKCTSPNAGLAECQSDKQPCDGLECAGACVPNDERNCGSCGHDCTALPNVSGPTSCDAGACVVPQASCEPGHTHCSNNLDDGCETKLSEEATCGACDVKCPATAPVCARTAGSTDAAPKFECSTGCSAEAPVLCGMSCVDTASDAAHCGACGMACPAVPNGQPVCEDGECGSKCNSGYHVCSGRCVSDKAPETCGDSCSPCPAPTGARATCDGKACGFSCTGSASLRCSDGCYPSSDQRCGSCDNSCRASSTVCDGSRCVECRDNSDCRGSTRYCVRSECKECEPGNASSCGDCQTCSAQGMCVSSGTSKLCYTDFDRDGYGTGRSTMVCGNCPDGSIDNNEDCYDQNLLAHPGATEFQTTDRGDGSFDYNCVRGEEPGPLTVPVACVCRMDGDQGFCDPSSTAPAPCGKKPAGCAGSCAECFTMESWSTDVQGCR